MFDRNLGGLVEREEDPVFFFPVSHPPPFFPFFIKRNTSPHEFPRFAKDLVRKREECEPSKEFNAGIK